MVGRTLHQYTILEHLGEGGMGVVYKARDIKLNRPVVVKTLRAERHDDPDKRWRFAQEAQAASVLNHPNIVTIHDILTDGDVDFIVMEYVEGRSLDDLIPEGGMESAQAMRLALQIVEALEAAHARGIVHRDLKPANIMVTVSGLVKLLDFGLAKLAQPASVDLSITRTVGGGSHTIEGTILGTIGYMSPEQALGKPTDGRCDIFSLGAVLYEMVTGRTAFLRDSAVATLGALLTEMPAAPDTINPKVSPTLSKTILRCLAKDPDERMPTASDLKLALRGGSNETKRDTPSMVSAPLPQNTISVLPFINLSADPVLEPVCDAVADDLTVALAGIPHLRVAPRSAAAAYKGMSLSVRQLGQMLQVSMVVEGTVRRVGPTLRITAQLTSTSDGYQLWSERYDSNCADLSVAEDQICVRLARQLSSRLKGPPRPDHPDLVAPGLSHIERFSVSSLPEARNALEQVLRTSGEMESLYAAMGRFYLTSAILGTVSSHDSSAKADWAVNKAAELGSTSGDARACAAILYGPLAHDWDRARSAMVEALALSPDSMFVQETEALWLLASAGDLTQAIARFERLSYHPSGPHSRHLAWTSYLHYLNHNYPLAMEWARRAVQIDSSLWLGHWAAAWAALGASRPEIAKLHAESALRHDMNVWTLGAAATCRMASGDLTAGRQHLSLLESECRKTGNYSWLAVALFGAEEVDNGFSAAANAARAFDGALPLALQHHTLDPYRRDPRLAAILNRIRLA